MKILLINVVCGIRSTGRICTDLAEALEKQGHEVKIAYGRENVPEQYRKYAIKIGNKADVRLHALKARLWDASGFGSRRATEKFIRLVRAFDPDIIHLHNLHGYYINLEILFSYLKNSQKKIIWTLHDCWAFTGHSPFCDAAGCKRWQKGCHHCAQLREYPISYTDRSDKNWIRKKRAFTGIRDMHIITPSRWLAGLVQKSFLKDYPVTVIHNGIDLTSFRPLANDFGRHTGIRDKKIVLGVASQWNDLKGLSDFVTLSGMLGDDYQIVLAGLSRKQMRNMPECIKCVPPTDSRKELAYIYGSADVFVNLTYCDNYPSVNLEASACGLPVITYDTGGCAETIEHTRGCCVRRGNLKEIKESIEKICRQSLAESGSTAMLRQIHDKQRALDACLKQAYGWRINPEEPGGGYFEIRNRYGLSGKICLLGVAAVWDGRKGLDDFIRLRKMLSEKYVILLAGLTPGQKGRLPEGMTGAGRTDSQEKLRQLYGAADFFLNFTTGDNYPTTNLESIACGTPVISYDTGGSGESALLYGSVVPRGDLDAVKKALERMYQKTDDQKVTDRHNAVRQYLKIMTGR